MNRESRLSRTARALLWAVCALVVLSGTGCGTTARQPIDLVVLHTNDVGGYIEPCG